MNLKDEKQKFLKSISGWKGKGGAQIQDREEQKEWALTHSINAALARGYVYSRRSPLDARYAFKEDWKDALRKIGARGKISEDSLVKEIGKVAADMSRKHGRILAKKKMRFGTSQKALNLYLKFLWCLEPTSEPPHCPLDRKILQKARVYDNWTELDSVAVYKKWIASCRNSADGNSLSVWELYEYNKKP